ncbi:MAG: Gfo/Idh/MocA family oxidoreductase [Acidobacteria bacterium]|nr:Gfo/Idh/MocA family oxidoreductase [Acidobacteriota bacterium]MCL5744967.1 Gfo/Idh/MocA family oxidoreductase [Acidobacteriota bacterium]
MALKNEDLKVAVIGGGMIANAAHIPAWQDQPGVRVVGVADRVLDTARATAQRHCIPSAYDDARRMLEELRPDAVSVCTPTCYHREHVTAALRAGAHVLCEKPVAAGSGDAEEMFQAAEAAQRTLLVGQSMRFFNQVTAARQFAAAGELGEIYYADASRLRRRGMPMWGNFHMKLHSGGGPLLDLGVHILDCLLWIMGNPKVVTASSVTFRKLACRKDGLLTSLAESGAPVGVFDSPAPDYRDLDVEDTGVVLLRLENGAAISLRVSWAANVPDSVGGLICVMGTEGGLSFDTRVPELKLVKSIQQHQTDISPKLPAPHPNHPFYAHWKEVAHFVRVIRGEEEPVIKREEVLNVIRALEAAYRSAALGSEVRLDGQERRAQGAAL